MLLIGKDTKYNLTKVLGKGEYGTTYLANDEYGAQYAIKKYSLSAGGKENRDFEQTMLRTILGVCNKHAVCFVESITQDGEFYVVMDYIEGASVEKMIYGPGKMPLSKRRNAGYEFMKDLIVGLHSIHQFGLIHQDIKGENLMYKNESVRYIDFGASCLANTVKQIGSNQVFGILYNDPCGAPGSNITISPEMYNDMGLYQLVHLKAHDIWSVGCMILAWFTVKDNETESIMYQKDFERVDHYTNLFKKLKSTEPLAYNVVIGLMTRDPYQRVDNFGILVDHFSSVFSMFSQDPEFVENWKNPVVTNIAKRQLCEWRKEIKRDDPELEGVSDFLIGVDKCN